MRCSRIFAIPSLRAVAARGYMLSLAASYVLGKHFIRWILNEYMRQVGTEFLSQLFRMLRILRARGFDTATNILSDERAF